MRKIEDSKNWGGKDGEEESNGEEYKGIKKDIDEELNKDMKRNGGGDGRIKEEEEKGNGEEWRGDGRKKKRIKKGMGIVKILKKSMEGRVEDWWGKDEDRRIDEERKGKRDGGIKSRIEDWIEILRGCVEIVEGMKNEGMKIEIMRNKGREDDEERDI